MIVLSKYLKDEAQSVCTLTKHVNCGKYSRVILCKNQRIRGCRSNIYFQNDFYFHRECFQVSYGEKQLSLFWVKGVAIAIVSRTDQ